MFWRNRLHPSSEHLLKMQTIIYSETLLPRPQVLPTYTTSCLFTTVKHRSKKHSGWFMEEKVNYSTTLCSEQTVHDVCWCTVHCSELRFVLPVKWNKKVNGYNKTKSCKSFWNAKCYEFYTYGWIYCQHNCPRYMQLPKQKWNKYHNYIYRWTWQIVTATVLYSTQNFHKFIGEQTVFWILRST